MFIGESRFQNLLGDSVVNDDHFANGFTGSLRVTADGTVIADGSTFQSMEDGAVSDLTTLKQIIDDMEVANIIIITDNT